MFRRLSPPADVIPYVEDFSEMDTVPWRQRHGWVHPSRNRAPFTKCLPLDCLEQYRPTEEERLNLVYGDLTDESSMDYLRKSASDIDYAQNVPIAIEEEYKPLIQKLVLRVKD